MDFMQLWIGLVSGLIIGGLVGWLLRAGRAGPERLRLVEGFEGRTRLAERELEVARRQLLEAELSLQETQVLGAAEDPRVLNSMRQVEGLQAELAKLRAQLEEREHVLEDLTRDDLSKLPGVGPVLLERLTDVGIEDFVHLAGMDERAIKELAAKLNIPLRTIQRHDWPKHAARLADERQEPAG